MKEAVWTKVWLMCLNHYVPLPPDSILFIGFLCKFGNIPKALQVSSVQFIHSVTSDSFQSHGLEHARLSCPLPAPGVYSNSSPLSQWWHPTISSSVVPFSCLQSSPTSGSFQMSQFFASGSQSIGVLASASVLPMNIQDWFPLGWTGWISLQSKRLSRVFSKTTVQRHQFSDAQLFFYSPSLTYIHDHWKNHGFD